MKVFLEVPSALSHAMFRVANALRQHAPASVEIVKRAEHADLHVLHVIGHDAIGYRSPAKDIAVIQYCLNGDYAAWRSLWDRSHFVWSYYDLREHVSASTNFLWSPLGLDDAFRAGPDPSAYRTIGALTSGYVSGPGAEAIEEVMRAAHNANITCEHIGPVPENDQLYGIGRPKTWRYHYAVPDRKLCQLYSQTQYVSGLRFREGFELPVIEGMSQGCRPIVFKRADTHWFSNWSIEVEERNGLPLIDELTHIFNSSLRPMLASEIAAVRSIFDWRYIAQAFWKGVLHPRSATTTYDKGVTV